MKAFYFILQNCTMIMKAGRAKLDGLGDTIGDTFGNAAGNSVVSSFRDKFEDLGDTVGETVQNSGTSDLVKGDYIDMKLLIILAAVIALILLILLLTGNSRRKALLEKKFTEYDILAAEVDSRMRYCTEELVKVKHNMESITTLSPSDTKLRGAARFDDIRTDMEHIRADLRENTVKLEAAKKNRDNVKKSLGVMTAMCRNMSGTSKRLERNTAELREANQADGKLISELEKAHKADEVMRNSEIRCSLSVSGISGLPGATGMMSAKDFSGKFRKGSYRLDDIPLLGKPGFLGSQENLGPINLSVYGMPDRDGLILRGSEKFTIKSGDGSSVRTDCTELLRGNVYELTAKTGKGSSRMELIVQ